MARSTLFISMCAVGAVALLAPARAQSVAPGPTALNIEMRMSTLDDQMRELTGRVEELTNTVNQLKQQLDRQASDTDLRFSQLQGGGAAAPGAPGAAVPLRSESQSASRSGSRASPGAEEAPVLHPPNAPPPRQTAAAGAALPSGSPQDQYNNAMGLLTQANYPAAEQAMRAFVARFPRDPLAGNAQYWLGETFYVRKDYGNAATAFAQGYEKYPKGPKAADDLLKLGMSLAALNQKPDACKAYARLQHDFPAPAQSIKERLASEKKRADC